MTLSNRVIQFNRPVKAFKISYYGDHDVSVDQAESLKKDSYEAGYQDAERFYKDKILELQTEVAARQAKMLHQLETEFQSFIQTVNNSFPGLVTAIAERVVGGVPITREIIDSVVKEIVSEFNDSQEELVVSLCENDFKLLKSADSEPEEKAIPSEEDEQDFSAALAGIFDSFEGSGDEEFLLPGLKNIKFQIDTNLQSGDCIVKSRFGIIDGRVKTKLQKIRSELEPS
jgi:flagellar biosynthesis/type III secretory pathway protein FliH